MGESQSSITTLNNEIMLGTVVITGANGQVGQALLAAFQANAQASVALVRQPTPLPATKIISDWLNQPAAVKAIQEAQAIVHLAGNLKPQKRDYHAANIAPTQVLAKALKESNCQHLVFLSYVGAKVNSQNAYLATKAQAEIILQDTGISLTVLRCSHIIGIPTRPGPTATSLLSHQGKAVTVLGPGENQVAPIFLNDVVAAIIQALSQKQAGNFDLVGPQPMTINQLVQLLHGSEHIEIKHLPTGICRILPWLLPDLPAALVDVMLKDSLPTQPLWSTVANLPLTPLTQVWTH